MYSSLISIAVKVLLLSLLLQNAVRRIKVKVVRNLLEQEDCKICRLRNPEALGRKSISAQMNFASS